MLQNLTSKFIESLGFVYPIAFEVADPMFPYYCGGTCFAVRFRSRLFIITATHCLTGREGHPTIIGPDGKVFPIRQSFPVSSRVPECDWADITCFSTYDQKHWPALDSNNAVDLDSLLRNEVFIDPGDLLAFKGFPTSHTEVELNPEKMIRKPSFHVGRYRCPTADDFCHYADVFYPPLKEPDGFSGTPIVKIDCLPGGEPFSTLIGILTRSGENCQIVRFIGVNILIQVVFAAYEKMESPAWH